MSKAKDQNDQLLDGTLPRDPSAGAKPVAPVTALRRTLADIAPSGVAKDEQAEASLLGMLLWCAANAPEAVTIGSVADLLPNDGAAFAVARNALIYETICGLASTGTVADATSVHSALTAVRKTREAGGMEYLESLVSLADSHSPARARRYAQSVRDMWLRRRVEQAAVDAAAQCRAGALSPIEATTVAIESMREIAADASGDAGTVSLKDGLLATYRSLQTGVRRDFLTTGIRDLDAAIGGFFPKETTVLGARTSVGKSALATQIASHVGRPSEKTAVLYVSLEMSADSFIRRMLATLSRVPARSLRRNDLPPESLPVVQGAIFELSKQRIVFADKSSQTLLEVHVRAKQTAASMALQGISLGLIIVDHIGLIKPSSKGAERKRNEQVAETSRGLRFLAEQHNCHVLALAQIGRGSEARKGTDKVPKLHDLKESGAIEEDADNVILLHRDRDEHGVWVKDSPAWCVVAKSRNDDLAAFRLKYDGSQVRFDDWDQLD